MNENPNDNPKKKSSCGCCFLKVLGVFVALVLVVGIIVGYFVNQTMKWAEKTKESTPVAYAPLVIAPGEQEDVESIIQRIHNAKKDKSVIDVTVSPNVFNGVIDKISGFEREKGKEPDFEAFRLGLEGEHFTLSATKKIKEGGEQKYVNVQLTFDCEIEDGHINTLTAHKIIAGGNEAPGIVKTFLSFAVDKFVKGVNDGTTPEARKLNVFKLVKREGDRVHIILDPTHFDQPRSNVRPPDLRLEMSGHVEIG